MDKTELIKRPIEKELGEFRELFESSLESSNPPAGRSIVVYPKAQRENDASYISDVDGQALWAY